MIAVDKGSGLLPPLIHVTPLVSSEARMHVLDETCWCQPTIAYIAGRAHQVFHHDLDWPASTR